MSYDKNLYVGVFIKVPKKIAKVDTPVKVFCTADANHSVRSEFKFCPLCGAPVGVKSKRQTMAVTITPNDVAADEWCCPESINDVNGYSIWLPNTWGDKCQCGFDGVLSIDQGTIAAAIAAFRMNHQPIVDKLNNLVDGVVVEFGAVEYWS